MKNYKIEVYDGFMKETATGYKMPKLTEVFECKGYASALKWFKLIIEQMKSGWRNRGAVLFIDEATGDVKTFKTIGWRA